MWGWGLTIDSELVPFNVSFQALFAPCSVAHLQLHGVRVPSLFSQDLLQLFLPGAASTNVRCLMSDLGLELIDLLEEGKFLVLLLADSALELSPVLLLVQSDRLEGLKLVGQLVALIAELLDLLLLGFELLRQVVNVPFEGQNFLDEIFLLVCPVSDLLLEASDFPLKVLHRQVEFSIFDRYSLYGLFQLLDLHVSVAVVGQDVLLLDLDSSLSLARAALSIGQLLILLFEDLVGMG